MQFHFARCRVCLQDYFNESELVFYGIRRDSESNRIGIRKIELNGRSPYCGVDGVCRKCVDSLASFKD